MKMWLVYEHISPSGKIYVGITSLAPKARWENGSGYVKCKAFYKAIQKYGWDKIEHNIIAEGLGEKTAKNMEIDLIKYNKERGISYNIANGGDGAAGHKCSELKRQQIGALWRGKKIPEETRKRMSLGQKGKVLPDSQKEKIRKAMLGNKRGNKAVLQFKNGVFIKEFPSCVDAAKELGIHPNNVSAVCRGIRSSTKGFLFVYKKDFYSPYSYQQGT